MKPKPYVGITGPASVEEVRDVVTAFHNSGYTMQSCHLPMLGILISKKTLEGQTTNRRFPKLNDLPALVEAAGNRVFTMIHYNTKDQTTLAGQVNRIFDGIYPSGLRRAIQLNIVWPDYTQVRIIKERFPDMQIVLQLNRHMIAQKRPREIVDGIEKYGDALDYVLIDPSGGRGEKFDLDTALGIYNEISLRLPDLSVGFAGGLDGDNVEERVSKIARAIGKKDFSIDAEGRLRDKRVKGFGNDDLNMRKVRRIFKRGIKSFAVIHISITSSFKQR